MKLDKIALIFIIIFIIAFIGIGLRSIFSYKELEVGDNVSIESIPKPIKLKLVDTENENYIFLYDELRNNLYLINERKVFNVISFNTLGSVSLISVDNENQLLEFFFWKKDITYYVNFKGDLTDMKKEVNEYYPQEAYLTSNKGDVTIKNYGFFYTLTINDSMVQKFSNLSFSIFTSVIIVLAFSLLYIRKSKRVEVNTYET